MRTRSTPSRTTPFLQSRAGFPLIVTTLVIMGFGMWLPFPPLGPALGFVHLWNLHWQLLAVMPASYVLLTQAAKWQLLRRRWI